MNELVKRFTYSSRKLAKKMYDLYRHCSKAEFEDLEATGLCALCISLNEYKGTGSFFSFWYTTAYNDMLGYIMEYSTAYPVDLSVTHEINIQGYDGEYFFNSGESIPNQVWADMFIEKMIEVLYDPKTKIRKIDKEIFAYYLKGYSYQEISEITGLNYFNVRDRIVKVRDIIANILKYSNE